MVEASESCRLLIGWHFTGISEIHNHGKPDALGIRLNGKVYGQYFHSVQMVPWSRIQYRCCLDVGNMARPWLKTSQHGRGVACMEHGCCISQAGIIAGASACGPYGKVVSVNSKPTPSTRLLCVSVSVSISVSIRVSLAYYATDKPVLPDQAPVVLRQVPPSILVTEYLHLRYLL